MPEPLRLGSIGFVNSLPVDWGLAGGAVNAPVRVVTDTPARLNEKLLSGELDLSPVSAFWYALNWRDLVLLPGLSISTQSIVMSVLLFSRRRPEELKDVPIAVSGQGRTTPALLEILCRRRWRFVPLLQPLPPGADPLAGPAEAVMLIGDDALRARARARAAGWIVTDLAQEWQRWTELPLVFALWAVRREVLVSRREDVEEAYQAILASRSWGLAHPEQILERARELSGLDRATLEEYFARLSYNFTEELQHGLVSFCRQAMRCDLLSQIPVIEFAFEAGADPAAAVAAREREVA